MLKDPGGGLWQPVGRNDQKSGSSKGPTGWVNEKRFRWEKLENDFHATYSYMEIRINFIFVLQILNMDDLFQFFHSNWLVRTWVRGVEWQETEHTKILPVSFEEVWLFGFMLFVVWHLILDWKQQPMSVVRC